MFFEVNTVVGTRFCVRLDTREMVHEAKVPTVPILAWMADRDAPVVFLLPADGGLMQAREEGKPAYVFSYAVTLAGDERAFLHPVTQKYISVQPDTRIHIHHDAIGHRESFTLSPFASAWSGTATADILEQLGARGAPTELRSLLALPHLVETPDIAHALLRLQPRETIRTLTPLVVDEPFYPLVFDSLRKILQRGQAPSRYFAPQLVWDTGAWQRWGQAGAYTYGDPRILPYEPGRFSIGKFCSIAEDVTIILGNHLTRAVTTFPLQSEWIHWPSRQASAPLQDHQARDVIIGNDVWIGRGATILAGAMIGDGAIIGADTVVSGKVPAYHLYAGNPGRVVRPRFDAAVIARLLDLAWWDWPDWKIDRHSMRLLGEDITTFLEIAEADSQDDPTVEA